MGVYIHALSADGHFSISLVSSAVTVSYLVTAAALLVVGTATVAYGPGLVTAVGTGTGRIGRLHSVVHRAWQVFLLMVFLEIGRSLLSTTTISTGLAPWFERRKGRAISMALLGAVSAGSSVRRYAGGIAVFGFKKTALVLAGAISLILLIRSIFVLKSRPQDLGLYPDGVAVGRRPRRPRDGRSRAPSRPFVFRRCWCLRLGMMVQIGTTSHHVSMTIGTLSRSRARRSPCRPRRCRLHQPHPAGEVFGPCRHAAHDQSRADRYRRVSSSAWRSSTGRPASLIASVAYGMTIGNMTTLSPIIVRREVRRGIVRRGLQDRRLPDPALQWPAVLPCSVPSAMPPVAMARPCSWPAP